MKFQHLPCFPRKMVLYLLIEFYFFGPCANVQSLQKKQVYRSLQNGKKIFGKFQCQPPFPRKMVLYLHCMHGVSSV